MLFDRIADGFKNAGLVFRDGKLAMICLGPDKANKILAADIPNEYGVSFRPIFNQRDFDTMWTMWDQVGQEARPRQYPPSYDLVGVSSDGLAAVVVSVQNEPSFGKQLLRGLDEATTHVPTADEKNPGLVFSLTLMSPQGLAIPNKPHNPTLK